MKINVDDNGRIIDENVMQVVNLCILKPNLEEILLIKSEKEPFKKLWGMPGGKVEDGETPYFAGARELYEETGITQKPRFPVGLCSENIFEKGKVKYMLSISVIKFVTESKYRRSEEGKLNWFAISELDELNIIPSDPKMISSFLFKGKYYAQSNIVKENGKYKLESYWDH